MQQPPLHFKPSPLPVTPSPNEFHGVLPTAEVGRLAAHNTKMGVRGAVVRKRTTAVGLISVTQLVQ